MELKVEAGMLQTQF